MVQHIGYDDLIASIDDQIGIYDVACPSCGPGRHSPANRRRKVLRVWHTAPGFINYSCARCGARGYGRAHGIAGSSPPRWAAHFAQQPGTDQVAIARRDKARWLWDQRRPICGTPAEVYLREARGYGGTLPATLGFLPKRAEHPPAMIAAFGPAAEIEPGAILAPTGIVSGVHLTRLAPDGRSKAGTDTDKIMVGTPRGSPIVVAPPGDLCGLAITEGIEDALSVHQATGLGTWAAGAAPFMPALAAAVPEWIESVTIMVDDDDAGRSNADALAERLGRCGFDVRLVILK
jgi:Toprim domain